MDAEIVNTGSASIAVAAGVVAPFIISFLKDIKWSLKVKQLVSFVVSLVIAIGITVVDNGISLDSVDVVLANLGVIFTTANVWYIQFFENTKLNVKIEEMGIGSK